MSGRPEFSVYWQSPDQMWNAERLWCRAELAVQLACALAKRPAAHLGIIRCIRITDGGDNCVFEWQYGKGVVFPERLEITDV
jgi:hypothetical protein